MNHLAHFFLAQRKPHLEIGAFLGDFTKGLLQDRYPEDIENGIRLHRKIDAFTDRHPIVKRSYSRIDPPLRRYAPIMIDVFYDHFLARQWLSYSPECLSQFSDRIFSTLESWEALLPPRAREAARNMRRYQVLAAYADANFLIPVLQRLSQRLNHANPLSDGFTQFEDNQLELAGDFSQFFPEVMSYARDVVSSMDKNALNQARGA